MEVIRHGVLVNLGKTAFLGTDGAGEVTEVIHGQWDVSGEGLTHSLAVLPGLRDSNLLQVLLDAVRNAVQQKSTFCRSGLAEGLEGFLGGVDSQVNVCFLTAGDLAEDLTGDRGDVVHVFAIDGRDPLAADVVVIALSEGDDGIVSSGVCIQSHARSAFLVGSFPSRRPPAQNS